MTIKSFFKKASFFLLTLISFSTMADNTPQFKQIVFLGDSLSDDGNLFRHTNDLIPKFGPYFKGRFSNGHNWADYLSYQLFTQYEIPSQNYAVGGATAVLHNPFNGYLPVTLSMEYDDYIAWNLLNNKDNTLYIIWIGANDYFPGRKNVDQATTDVVNEISSVVQELAPNTGSQFLIISLPDLSLVPQARERNLVANYQALADMNNAKLHAAILQLRAKLPNTKIMEFNFSDDPILKNLIQDPAYRADFNKKYNVNITNVTDSCWGGGLTQKPSIDTIEQTIEKSKTTVNNGTLVNTHAVAEQIANSPALMETYLVGQKAAQGDASCQDPDQHIFWDGVHPTRVMHKIIGKIMLDKILENQ